MKRTASASPEERGVLFREAAQIQAAAGRSLAAEMIEKDFWVCWTLERLFQLPEIAPHLLFKGGTTLSKAYGVIARFSEDIDISISRAFLRPDAADVAEEEGISKSRRKREIEALVAAFHDAVVTRIQPALREAIAAEIGVTDAWSLEPDEMDAGTLLFRYPAVISAESGYIRPEVKIEMGGRSDLWPEEQARLRAYAAESVPEAFDAPEVAVRVLAVERTFWEKATLLHSEFHRPPDRGRGERISRHYSDLVQLARHPDIGPRSLATRDVLRRVIEHKSVYYADSWSRYEEAGTGSMHLVPPTEAQTGLRQDYDRMRNMFFGEPIPFDEILDELGRLEAEINRGES